MRTHTSGFKSEIAKFGRQFNSLLSYRTSDAYFILTTESGDALLTESLEQLATEKGYLTYDNEHIYNIIVSCETELFKTTMPMIEFETDVKIPLGTLLNYKYGILVNGAYEYLDYGDYSIIEDAVYNADTKTYTHKAYKKMYECMVDYDSNPLNVTYPISLKNYIIAICNKFEWLYDLTANFPNQNTQIKSDLYIGLGMTYRDILDDICPATMGNFMFNDNYEFTIKYPTETGDVIDGEYIKDVNVEFGVKYGPVNSLTLSRAEDSDIIYRKDETSISANGLTELKIKDNILLSTEDRGDFIDGMFNYINGFEYHTCDFSSTGVCYYEPFDRFTVSHDGVDYSIVLLNDIQNIGQGLSEDIYLDKPAVNESDYTTSAVTDKSVKNAVIIANKNNAEIKLKVSYDDFGTALIQNSESLQISWNQISQKIQFATDGANASLQILDDSNYKLMQLDKTGMSFYYQNNLAGYMGTELVTNIDSGDQFNCAITRIMYDGAIQWQAQRWGYPEYFDQILTFFNSETNQTLFTDVKFLCKDGLEVYGGLTVNGSSNVPLSYAVGSIEKVNWIGGTTAGRLYADITSGGTVILVGTYTSDARLKKNIYESEVNATEFISKIKHRKFDFKADNKHKDIGYIAQELEELLPEAVINVEQYGEDGEVVDNVKQVDDTKLIPYLTKAIQEQDFLIKLICEKLNISEVKDKISKEEVIYNLGDVIMSKCRPKMDTEVTNGKTRRS